MKIKVSVIIPVYNTEQYLDECINSVLKQTLDQIEIITVDDGSTDKSLSILRRFASEYDNVIVLTQNNQGSGPARNNGIQHAKGEYLIFLDADDFYPSNDCLEGLYNAAIENNVSICGGIVIKNSYGARSINWLEEQNKQEHSYNKIVKMHDYTSLSFYQRCLFKMSLIQENNIYFPDYRRFQDPPFMAKAMVCSGEIFELDKEVYAYRLGHKEVRYSLKNSIDLLYGVRDVLKIAQEYGWIELYEKRIKNINEVYMIPFYKFSFCGNKEVDDTIEEINEIVSKWIGDKESLILTKEKVQEIRENSREEYDSFIKILTNDRNKIIYGAGVKAHALIGKHQNEMKNVLGVAVTKLPDTANKILAGLPIKRIEEYLAYSKKAIVMIITIPEYRDEIESNLGKLGFQNVLKINTGELELAEALRENL